MVLDMSFWSDVIVLSSNNEPITEIQPLISLPLGSHHVLCLSHMPEH